MHIKIPIDQLLKNWPVEAHRHLREKFGAYYVMEAYPCPTSDPQCRRGKARARCKHNKRKSLQ